MAFQLFNDGACIRIENGLKTMLVSKEQIKTIDTIQNNIVRIDIGEGPLKNIFINYQDVTLPDVASADDLRDAIRQMLFSDNYNGGDATEQGQINILTQLTAIAGLLQALKQSETDLANTDPSLIDESNPYVIYQGWHKLIGNPANPEWAIRRIRKEGDLIHYEWAFANQNKDYIWNNREGFTYLPFDPTGAALVPPVGPLPE